MGALVGPGGSLTIQGTLAKPVSIDGLAASERIRLTNLGSSNDGGNVTTNGVPLVQPRIPSGFNSFTAYKIEYKTYSSSQFPPYFALYVDDLPADAFPIIPKVSAVSNSIVRPAGPFTVDKFYIALLVPTPGMFGIITDVYITFYK
jgi:hypothetical protein